MCVIVIDGRRQRWVGGMMGVDVGAEAVGGGREMELCRSVCGARVVVHVSVRAASDYLSRVGVARGT